MDPGLRAGLEVVAREYGRQRYGAHTAPRPSGLTRVAQWAADIIGPHGPMAPGGTWSMTLPARDLGVVPTPRAALADPLSGHPEFLPDEAAREPVARSNIDLHRNVPHGEGSFKGPQVFRSVSGTGPIPDGQPGHALELTKQGEAEELPVYPVVLDRVEIPEVTDAGIGMAEHVAAVRDAVREVAGADLLDNLLAEIPAGPATGSDGEKLRGSVAGIFGDKHTAAPLRVLYSAPLATDWDAALRDSVPDVGEWVPTSLLPAGEAIVGAFFDGAWIVHRDLTVSMAIDHNDNLLRGELTFRGRWRALLWLRHPTAFRRLAGLGS